MKNKKGQLTVFIIIGIVLLFSAALILYIQRSVTTYKPPTEIAFEQAPTELVPLQNYVTDCLDRASTEAVRRLGAQGGYTDTTTFRVNDADPTEGNAVSFSSGSGLKIPYWWYLRSNNRCENDCSFDTKRPSLTQMQDDLNNFIQGRLRLCVGDFQQFAQQGMLITAGNITVDAQIGKTVIVNVNYPITVTQSGRQSRLTRFTSQVPVDLKRIYDYATIIANLEINYHFLERDTMEIISGFSGLNRPIPPMSDTEFTLGAAQHWMKSDVKTSVTSLLSSYIPILQVYGDLNYAEPHYSNTYQQGLYNRMILPIQDANQQPFSDFATRFSYLDWPIYFNVQGRGVMGDYITAESMSSSFISMFGIKRYQNYFDVSYPVVIEIDQPAALEGQGYTFLFALETNIRGSRELTSSYAGLPMGPLTEGQSYFCALNQRTSGNVTFHVNDAATNKPISDVAVDYSCGTESCNIGYTNSSGTMTSSLPICTGGYALASKSDYRSASFKYDAELGKSSTINLSVYPVMTKKILVKEKRIFKNCHAAGFSVETYMALPNLIALGYSAAYGAVQPSQHGYLSKETQRVGEVDYNCYWFYDDTARSLLNNEQAVISFTKIPEGPNDEEYDIVAVYYGNQTYTTVKLIPGKYEISMQLLYNLPSAGHSSVFIPSRDVTVDSNWIIPGGKRTTTMQGLTFNESFPEGGVEINSGNSYWELTANNLYNDNSIVFYALRAPDFTVSSDGTMKDDLGDPLRAEDVSQSGKVEDYTATLRPALEPVYTT